MAAGFKTAQVNASSVPATQTSFPSYVDLSRLGITTLAEAQSVRVYADSGKTTEWAREIVSATEMHVKIPSLTSTTSIYVDWDGSSADYAATDTYGRNAVWSDYEGVYHFETLTTDSTGNGNTLTNNNTVTQASGKLNGQAANFGTTNTNKYLSLGSAFGIQNAGDFSITFWFAWDATSVSGYDTSIHILNSSAGSVGNYIRSGYEDAASDRLRYFYFGNAPNEFNDKNIVITAGTWKYGAMTHDSADLFSGYDDGSSFGSYTKAGTYAQVVNGTSIGALVGGGDVWQGKMDEVRVSLSVLSANWITTEYNNQSDEAGFWGTWSDVGGGGSPDTTKFFALMH